MAIQSFKRMHQLGIPSYLCKAELPVKTKQELVGLANECEIPWYLRPNVTKEEKEKMEIEAAQAAKQLAIFKAMELPLIERLRLGMEYCTREEFHAFLWLKGLFERILYEERFGSGLNLLKHQSHYFGVCGFEVKYSECNPWIVNEIMEQLGIPLHSHQEYVTLVDQKQVPYSVQFTYKTFEVGIVNEMFEMFDEPCE